ncbi:hypothetical protein FA048_09805 [Pedobacter polaris]|uniref:Macroglobulin domain-containing protein n=1 Tax=Pedobacter polaris TaxID=2571273 RepID=A0A4U1CTP7_9SPHI|nr:hypothetical protein [Pedobacter polaris]TKC10470.1 hypothetical protein FA048_09805 [Pedobacter polaris]
MKFLKAVTFFSLCLISGHILAQKKAVVNQDPKTFKLFFEKAYLQIDRTYYSSGEDIWFAAYLVNGKSASLTSTSNNLYVELINSKSEVVDRKLIRIDKGLGKGDFKLKDTLQAGWYNIMAYTNWMRNFGDDFVFQKKVYINNAAKNNVQKPIAINSKKSITFFPEGGSLVEGLTSLVAFKTTDEYGNGLKTSGSIISSKGDTITTFQSTAIGMGSFAFTPAINEQYKIEGSYNNEKFASALPTVLKKGLSLHVTTDSTNIKASISANEVLFNELKGKPISIVIKHAGDNIYTGSITLSKATFSITIPTKDLPAGVAVFTVLDHLGRPNCERLIYIQSANKIKLTVNPNKPTYGSREQVTLNVRATNTLGQPAKTSLSLAVVDGLIPADANNIVSYLMLQSEVKGEIKDADQYFDVKNAGRFKQLDLLLLTQGWREYIWRKLGDSALKVSHLPEPGITIKGLVREKLKDKPLPDMNITLFGSNFIGSKIFTTKTDAAGHYFLDGLKWYGNQAVKISSQDNKGKKGGWLQIDTSFLTLPITIQKINPLTVPNHVDDELGKRMTYNRTYKIGDSILLKEVNIIGEKSATVQLFDQTLTTFGYPDQVFNITAADYSYRGLEHFLLTKVEGTQSVDELGSAENLDSNSNEGVVFLVNGKKVRPRIIVNNKEDIQGRLDYYSLTMDQINKIVVKHLIGNSSPSDGAPQATDVYVISLDLKDSALRGPNLHLLNLNLNGYYAARSFYSPNYTSNSTNNKDLRTTIFWAPLLKTNDKGEVSVSFFNADNKGEVVIKADGITDNGIAVSSKTTYKIQ